jgi:hypothetical protein
MSYFLEPDIMDQDLNFSMVSGLATQQESQSHTEFPEAADRNEDDERGFQQRHVGENEGKGRRVQEGYNEKPQFQNSTEQLNHPVSDSGSTGINTKSGKEDIGKADINERRDGKSKAKRCKE